MKLSKMLDLLKCLDDHLSDAVYLHGCYLTGTEKIAIRNRQRETGEQPQEVFTGSHVRVPCKL